MRGELRYALDRALAEVWMPLLDDFPGNLLGEVYVVLAGCLLEPQPDFVREVDGTVRDATVRLEARAAEAANDSLAAERLLRQLSAADFPSESAVLRAFESVHETIEDIGGAPIGEAHLGLLRAFIEKFNLRYYVDDEGRFWVTFPGVAAVVFRELRAAARGNPHLSQELDAFEHALAECLRDPIETRIKTAIQKQFNVLEAFGSCHPAVTGNTLGRMLDQVDSWPHSSMPEVGRGLYKFASDYPGIRHGGNFEAARRPLDLRDLMGVALSLVGLAPYLSDGFEATVVDAFFETLATDDGFARAPWLPAPITAAGA